jgi:hypothetical protein
VCFIAMFRCDGDFVTGPMANAIAWGRRVFGHGKRREMFRSCILSKELRNRK